MMVMGYLHSTMYLFQQGDIRRKYSTFCDIYIPLCIYFNTISLSGNGGTVTYLHSTMYLFQLLPLFHKCKRRFIYIPLCIYFNKCAI